MKNRTEDNKRVNAEARTQKSGKAAKSRRGARNRLRQNKTKDSAKTGDTGRGRDSNRAKEGKDSQKSSDQTRDNIVDIGTGRRESQKAGKKEKSKVRETAPARDTARVKETAAKPARKNKQQTSAAQKTSKKLDRKKNQRQKNRISLADFSLPRANPAEISASYLLAAEEEKRRIQLSERAKARAAEIGAHPAGKIKIIMLGGLEQIGMNITAFESDNSIVIVDCGMAFPDDSMLGIDLVIPDISYLKARANKIEGFFITHGHEDHIGALPYVLRELNVPVYATRLTRALIENKLLEVELLDSAKLRTVQFGDFVGAGDFTVEFIKTNHSIQDAAALAIHTPAGVILHTGDFKVDYTPVFGDTIDLQRFAELGKNGVLALLCDSTNAIRQGFTMSERTVGKTFESIFSEHSSKRIIVATFASNVDRVQQVINVAEKHGRKVAIDGRSMVKVIGTAAALGYIQVREGTLIDIDQIRNYPPEQMVLVVTGSQGESMAALSRMATGQHRKVSLNDKDVIVMSSTPIPGNEKAVSRVINELSRRHTKVIYQDTHVSGHACVEELKLIYALVHPKFAIPVHGEFRHRLAQREVALAIGVPKENILMADTGDVIEISQDVCRIIDHVQAGPVLVDGLGVGDVGNIVLRDRQSLSQNGIIIAVLTLERGSGEIVAGPDIVTRGFVYVRENEALIKEAMEVVMTAAQKVLESGSTDWAHMKNVIRDALNEFIWRRMKRTPMILPIISEV